MAAFQNIQATFAALPHEICDMVYTQMLTNTETIDTIWRTDGLGQQEDWKKLRGTLHACRDMPQYSEEAIEVFFEMHTLRTEAERDFDFLNRPAYYVKARDIIPMMMLVKSIETRLTISTTGNDGSRDPLRLRKCFRDFLACPLLRRVTVNVGLPSDWAAEQNDIPTADVVKEDDLAELDIILNAATGSWQGAQIETRGGIEV